jgi:hypothetical protein
MEAYFGSLLSCRSQRPPPSSTRTVLYCCTVPVYKPLYIRNKPVLSQPLSLLQVQSGDSGYCLNRCSFYKSTIQPYLILGREAIKKSSFPFWKCNRKQNNGKVFKPVGATTIVMVLPRKGAIRVTI